MFNSNFDVLVGLGCDDSNKRIEVQTHKRHFHPKNMLFTLKGMKRNESEIYSFALIFIGLLHYFSRRSVDEVSFIIGIFQMTHNVTIAAKNFSFHRIEPLPKEKRLETFTSASCFH